MNNYMNYQKMQVTTSDRLKLVVMLYDGAISFLKTAIKYIEKNDMASKGIFISKAQDIIDELNNSLNIKDGGEIAVNLRKIYNFLYFYLVKANISKNKDMILEVISILNTLKEAWEEISKKGTEQSTNTPPTEKIDLTGEIRA